MGRLPLIVSILLLGAGGTVVGLAASLGVATGTIGTDLKVAPRCTNAALQVVPLLTSGLVSSVTVSTLPAGCGGATLKVSVNNGTASGSGSATVPGGGGSVTVPISVAPLLDANVQTDLVLEGP